MIVGFYNESDAYPREALEGFFNRLSESNGKPGKPFYMPNGTPFFCTAAGTLLKKGLTDWDKLPESETKPGAIRVPAVREDPERVRKSRRLTRPPANTLILRAYVRGLKMDKDRLFADKVIAWDYNSKLPAEPNRDFMWLQEKEWHAIIDPPGKGSAKGREYAIPDAVRDRLCHWHIAGGYHGLPGYYTSENFQSKHMTVQEEASTPERITLRLRGKAALKSGAAYRFHGVLTFNREKRGFTRFDVIALCDEGHDVKPRPQNVAPFRHYGIAFELAGDRTDDLLPPFYVREHVGTPERYFANTAR